MLNMAIPVPDLAMMSTEPSNALGSSMCSLFFLIVPESKSHQLARCEILVAHKIRLVYIQVEEAGLLKKGT
jgi:hypothetical protein